MYNAVMYTPLRFAKEKNLIRVLCSELDACVAGMMDAIRVNTAWSWTSDNGFVQNKVSADIADTLGNFEYVDYEKAPPIQAVVCCAAVVAAQVVRVNNAKQRLKESFVSFDNIRVDVDGERRPLALAILRDLGRSEMNRLLAYRHIYSFIEPPELIGFSRSNVRTVARKTNLQVLAWLSKMTQENSEPYRNTVMALPEHEPLALVKGRYSSQRANVKINGQRKMIPAHLPLIIAAAPTSSVPIIKAARVRQEGVAVTKRADKRLRDIPLFEVGAITVYRYREEYLAQIVNDDE